MTRAIINARRGPSRGERKRRVRSCRVARIESAEVVQPNRARNRDRTDDLILTKDVLYRLSYASMPDAGAARGKSVKVSGRGAGLKCCTVARWVGSASGISVLIATLSTPTELDL